MSKFSNYTYTKYNNEYKADNALKGFIMDHSYTLLLIAASITSLILLGDWSKL